MWHICPSSLNNFPQLFFFKTIKCLPLELRVSYLFSANWERGNMRSEHWDSSPPQWSRPDSIMNSVTIELWPVASRFPQCITSRSCQGFHTSKQKESDFFFSRTHMELWCEDSRAWIGADGKGKRVSDKRPKAWGEKYKLPSWEIELGPVAITTMNQHSPMRIICTEAFDFTELMILPV